MDCLVSDFTSFYKTLGSLQFMTQAKHEERINVNSKFSGYKLKWFRILLTELAH